MSVRGIDVASYQPDHPTVKGLAFVFVKATEGTTYKNPRMAAQVATARAAGAVVGFYHFLHAGKIPEQARYFLGAIEEHRGDILACDWEMPPNEKPATCAEKDAFIREVKALDGGYKVGLYANRDFWLHKDVTSGCGDFLWIADPTTAGHPRVQHPWTFHQYAVSGGTDQNVGNFADMAALRKWAGVPAPKPPAGAPAPAPTIEQRVTSLETRVTALEKR
jgi:GH25 family lysozyme M1 (1,4-beta-N-acetylmuramidase)